MIKTSKQARMSVTDPHAIQLYSAATPNGLKAAIALEELVDLRSLKEDFKYEPHTVNIRGAENKKPDYLEICPNGKIPSIRDPKSPTGAPATVWESGSILLYLAEKYNELLPTDMAQKIETINWLFWASSGLSVQAKAFGFYYKYCSHKIPYAVSRHAKECHRLLEVLEKQLKSHNKHWIMGGNLTYYDDYNLDSYTIADIATWPWIYALHENYDDAAQTTFDCFNDYPSITNWYRRCLNRPAVQRALDVTPFVV